MLESALIYLAAAIVAVPIAKRLGLGSVLGYLLAGILIGPFLFGLVGDQTDTMHFAEFGVVMMLFLVGLELQPSMIWKMKGPIFGMGGMQVGLTSLIIVIVVVVVGLPWQTGLAIGFTLALSSTAIVLQTLNEKGLKVSKLFPKGTILITVAANIGYSGVLQIDMACPDSLVGIKTNKNISNYYLNYRLEKEQSKMEYLAIDGAQKNINLDFLKPYVFSFPQLPEQQKIASFLTDVDAKITKLTKKKALLAQYKKGVMQKIFKQELRFKDDDGNNFSDWEMKKLGDLGNTLNGLTGKTKENFGSGKPYIQYKQIFDSSRINIDNCGLVDITITDKQTKVQYGDVFFTTSSETPNEIGTASVLLDNVEEMYLNSFCFGFRVNQLDLYPSFSQFLFRSNSFRKKMIPLAQGSTRYNISKSAFVKLKVSLPCIKEQTKIANFLSAIDLKIEALNTKIENSKNFKKGLLQQMFV